MSPGGREWIFRLCTHCKVKLDFISHWGKIPQVRSSLFVKTQFTRFSQRAEAVQQTNHSYLWMFGLDETPTQENICVRKTPQSQQQPDIREVHFTQSRAESDSGFASHSFQWGLGIFTQIDPYSFASHGESGQGGCVMLLLACYSSSSILCLKPGPSFFPSCLLHVSAHKWISSEEIQSDCTMTTNTCLGWEESKGNPPRTDRRSRAIRQYFCIWSFSGIALW